MERHKGISLQEIASKQFINVAGDIQSNIKNFIIDFLDFLLPLSKNSFFHNSTDKITDTNIKISLHYHYVIMCIGCMFPLK